MTQRDLIVEALQEMLDRGTRIGELGKSPDFAIVAESEKQREAAARAIQSLADSLMVSANIA